MAKIAILGGGASGLAAAFDLTAVPARHEVTVHEMSWRLGGKGASGRNPLMHDRIEEHGLHIWFGFYANAFAILEAALRERAANPKFSGERWGCIDDAFTPVDSVTLYSDQSQDGWGARRWTFPERPRAEGELWDHPDVTYATIVSRAMAFLKSSLADDPDAPGGEPPSGGPAAAADADEWTTALEAALSAVTTVVELQGVGPMLLKPVLNALRATAGKVPPGLGALTDYAQVVDVFTTILVGMIDDDLLDPDTQSWQRINQEELCAWMHRNGAQTGAGACSEEDAIAMIADLPLIRCFYQLCFAYIDGDRARPDLAAGKAIQALIRLAFTYQRHLMWKMNSGMGDTIFGPLYDVLKERGVTFCFNERVTDLIVENGALTKVTIARTPQPATVKDEHWPLRKVGDLRCWPTTPGDYDPEHAALPEKCESAELVQGIDFDHAILAVGMGAVTPLAAGVVAANPAFKAMIDAIPTVATQALQVWFARKPAGAGDDGLEVAGSFAPPLDTYSGMDQVSDTECFPAGAVEHVAYFCGVMQDDPTLDHDEMTQRAHDDGLDFLANDAHLMHLMDDGAPDWESLYDPEDRKGQARYEAQYWRANTEGTHRYTLTPAGSLDARLKADQSGVEHLVLAGDWTDNGVCGGCVEAAVTSGRLAAKAIDPALPDVQGTSGWLERS